MRFLSVLSATVGAAAGWKLNPIEVHGQHLRDSVTKEPFLAKGIGFPNLGDAPISEWVAVLKRIHSYSDGVNVIRVYIPPSCAMTTDCAKEFMEAADDMGIYVLLPGTGTVWGWLPGPGGCKPATADGCYKAGGVLGWGQKMLQAFNYPNTLALVIGNEFDMQQPQFMPTLKGYARDLKAYMKMCNEDAQSPSKGQMRQIPLMYASSDDRGDPVVQLKADYLFCGEADVSVDIFGLNIERWCDPSGVGGKIAYGGVNKWVGDKQYPGAFVLSEMGCFKGAYQGTRDWAQVTNFGEEFPNISGYAAYTYFGNPNFNMFDGAGSTANIFQDGKNFFKQVDASKKSPKPSPFPDTGSVTPTCAAGILDHTWDSVDSVKWYDTGSTGWAPSCPKPAAAELIIV